MPESHGHLSEEEMLHFLQNPIQSLLYNQINSASGINTLKEIIDEAKKYEISDLLSKVSSLNLIIENQNKGIYFDSLIAALISQPLSVYSSKKIIRTKELRKLISQIEKTGLSFAIDPPEVLFIDRVRFYGNYWIFPGNNYIPAFIIQNFIDALIFNEKIFDPVFFQIALHIINFVLTLSNDIANALEYGYHTQRKAEKKYVQIPNYEEIHKYASTLVFDLDKILSILKIDTADFLFIDFAETKLDDIIAFEVKDFSFAKNPYEMEQEYKRMFVDGDKICFTTKHKRRVDWLQKHMSDTIYEFDLKPGKWKVLEAYIVNEDIISNKYHKRGKNILLYSMLNEESIEAIL